MQKTENLRNILTEILWRNELEPKMLEQKVFELWKKEFGVRFGKKTMPVSLSNGVLKIYTEYPTSNVEILFLKQSILSTLNAELEQPILTDLRIELRQVDTPPAREPKQPPSRRASSNSASPTPAPYRITPEELEHIEQMLASITDENLKKSLRQLFTTQRENKP